MLAFNKPRVLSGILLLAPTVLSSTAPEPSASYKSPKEMLFLTGLGASAFSSFAWFTCLLWTGNEQAGSRTCATFAAETGALALLVIPPYFWKDEDWEFWDGLSFADIY